MPINTAILSLIITIQDIDAIKEKIANAPGKGYEIGVFIGTILPFVVLVTIAYLIYRYNKNRINKE